MIPSDQKKMMKTVTRIVRPQSSRKVTVFILLTFIISLVSRQSRADVLVFVFLFFRVSMTE